MKVVVLGAGESGVGAAILSQSLGYTTFVSDMGDISQLYREELRLYDIEFEEHKHSVDRILREAELVIKSPGIPDTAPLIKSLKERNIEVISEIEFGWRYYDGKVLAVTGSNGKTTTVSLIGHLMKSAGVSTFVGGNIGKSFARAVAQEEFSWAVLELSSFQLDGVDKFRADIALLLNITPDHLDRYDYNMENYISSKFKILQNQDSSSVFIFSQDDKTITERIAKSNILSKKLPFSIEQDVNIGGGISSDPSSGFDGDFMVIRIPTKETRIALYKTDKVALSELSIKGKHNISNCLAALLAVESTGVKIFDIIEYISSFKGVSHRMEVVDKINGVTYINDSKATNVDAVFYALESMKSSTIWIVGGVDKGNDYKQLNSLVADRVKMILCLGVDNKKLVLYAKEMGIPYREYTDITEAVNDASKCAKTGESVLLSPACASFDLFQNYEDRGDQFRVAVEALSKS